MDSDEREIDPIHDHSVPADADFSAAGSDEAGPNGADPRAARPDEATDEPTDSDDPIS